MKNVSKRIMIIGSPGAGKTTFAKQLLEVLHMKPAHLYHMDSLYWNKDGTHITKKELENKIEDIMSQNTWVLDGNYQSSLEFRVKHLKENDTIFLLDLPLEQCLQGAEQRVGKIRDDMPFVEDGFSDALRQSILLYHKDKRQKTYMILSQIKDCNIIFFTSHDEIDDFIIQLRHQYKTERQDNMKW